MVSGRLAGEEQQADGGVHAGQRQCRLGPDSPGRQLFQPRQFLPRRAPGQPRLRRPARQRRVPPRARPGILLTVEAAFADLRSLASDSSPCKNKSYRSYKTYPVPCSVREGRPSTRAVPFSATAHTEEIGRMEHPPFRFAGAARIFKKGCGRREKKGIRGLFILKNCRTVLY